MQGLTLPPTACQILWLFSFILISILSFIIYIFFICLRPWYLAGVLAPHLFITSASAILELGLATPYSDLFASQTIWTLKIKTTSLVLWEKGRPPMDARFHHILFFGPSVMLKTDCKKLQIFRPINILTKFHQMALDKIHFAVFFVPNSTFSFR